MIPKKYVTTFLSSLITINSFLLVQAQPEANKPQVTITATPGGTVPVKSIPLFYSPEVKVNFVRTKEAVTRITNEMDVDAAPYQQVKQSTQYLDGLGRPLQTVMRQVTPGSDPKDMIVPLQYDGYGREVYKYLPYIQTTGSAATTSDGSFKMDPFNSQDNFYKNVYKDANGKIMYDGEQFLYGQTDFEPSPLNRIKKVKSPGNSWTGKDKGITKQYLVNTALDAVHIWTIGNNTLTIGNQASTNIPVSLSSAVYEAGQLYKNVTEDENGNAVVEYKDKQDQVVLKKVQAGDINTTYSGYDGWLSTYYIYDDFNRLRFVVPPAAVEIIKTDWSLTTHNNVVNELCFRYEYDEKGRMISKKVPGAAWVEMIYDDRDRLVYTRDGNMRNNHQWMVTLYDDLNRQVLTGMLQPCDLTRDLLQPYVNNAISVTSISVDGSGPSSTPPAMSVGNFQNNTSLYQASESITFMDGFNSGNGASFVAEIVPPATSSFTTVVEVTDPRPPPGDYPFIALTMTYYDNYSDLSDYSYKQDFNSKLDVGVNPFPEPVVPASDQDKVNVTGMVTGTKVRILEDPNNLSAGKWLTSVMYYDDRGRVIQTYTENHLGGNATSTSRYEFTSKVISNYIVNKNPKASETTTIQTLMNYDHSGRLETIYKTLNDQTDKKTLIVSNTYDELGQLKTKALGKKYASTEPLEKLDYTYNVRGWLKGINAAFSHPELNAGSAVDRWFGMELNYDYGSGFSNNKDRNQYNGNISSVTWRSKGDGVQRAYGYTYDQANRIMGADFSERSASSNSYNDNANVNFDMVMNDGGTHSGYDANGNIKGMTQWGLKLNSSSVIDKLTYDYYENSNKLKTVSEPVNTLPNNLGDFTDNNTTGNDYGYDVNGNMITDLNKRIKGTYTPDLDQTSGAIIYNHLNLPWKIMMKKDDNSTSKGYISYKYDAGGNKLSKTVHEDGVTQDKITDYVSGMVYEQDILQFIPHEEGRARVKNTDGVVSHSYDYYIKDHLGNVRMVLTDEQDQSAYPAATLETTTLSQEQQYYNIPDGGSVRVNADDVSGYPGTSPKGYIHKLNGDGTKVGSSILLKVMAGDKVNIFANSWYTTNTTGGYSSNSAASGIASVLDELVASSSGGKFTSTALHSTGLMSAVTSLFSTSRDTQTPAGTKPKAYVNWILFDNQMKIVLTSDGKNSGAEQVGNDNEYKSHVIQRELTQSGYLYIYVSNESQNINVFFDNLTVTHIKGPLLEETHYYPFGLAMAGISNKATGSLINKYKFNKSTELNTDFEINLYETECRLYDPQIGKFWQVDELAEAAWEWTPYIFGLNNPIRINDPLGLEAEQNGYLEKKEYDKRRNGRAGNYQEVLPNVTLTGKHTQANLQKTYWYYRNNGIGIDKAPKGIQNWLYKNDRVERFMERVYEMRREQDIIALNIASNFLPVGWITKLKYVKYAATLFKIKRGAGIVEKALTTILGKYPNYLKAAEEMGYNKFSIPENVWGKMTEAEQWAANSNFLDEAIARGDEIIFSHQVKAVTEETGAFKKELDYLIDKGYHLTPEGTGMIK